MPRDNMIEMVSVVGLGYVGLPTAAVFAARGFDVVGVDVDPGIVQTINRGAAHIAEPGLDRMVRDAVAGGLLRATCAPEPAGAFLIAVPTPLAADGSGPDLSFVEAAVRSLAPVLAPGNLVVLESTSPVGTTERMASVLAVLRPDLSFPQQDALRPDISIAYCPERVLPGRAMQEIISNDRVIGGMTARCAAAAKALYECVVEGACLVTDVRTAEMCKLAENTFRDVNIAYANELSRICDRLHIDVWELIRLANRHPRVDILKPGAGVGGHCIAVDPWFIVAGAPDESHLIRAARETNDAKPAWVLGRIGAAVTRHQLRHATVPTIAVLGLAFKPDIEDMRESPALWIAEQLCRDHGERLLVVEPHVRTLPPTLAESRLARIEAALDQADIVAVLVNHTAFGALAGALPRPGQQIIDVVGLLAQARPHSAQPAPRRTVVAAE